jgi:hypothetical protein
MTTFRLTVQGASFLTINVSAIVFLRGGVAPATARETITTSLEAFFEPVLEDGSANPSVNFGYYFQDADGNPTEVFAWSDIFNVVRDDTSVRKVDPSASGFLVNGVREDVAMGVIQFPVLGTVTLTNGDTGVLF